jgi:hypothetical protein
LTRHRGVRRVGAGRRILSAARRSDRPVDAGRDLRPRATGQCRQDQGGKIACYFREEGSSHSLDIGTTADGAFIRLETFDSRETTPTPPLRVFAGKQMAKGEYATNEFAVLQAYDATFEFYVPKPSQGDFVVVAKGDAKSFFEMVARARMEFVVVQSVADRKNVNIVAIYKFKTAAIPALLSCAKERIQ